MSSLHEKTKEAGEKVTARIMTMLEAGTIPWKQSWKTVRPCNIDGKTYNGINRLLLSGLPYTDPRFVTFKKVKELGGMVRKGEHGHMVIFWNSWQTMKKNSDGTETPIVVPYAGAWTIFNVEQCDGLKLKELTIKAEDFIPCEKAESIIEAWADKPEIEHGIDCGASYYPTIDTIQLPSKQYFHAPEGYYQAAFHELVHSTGSPKRLSRFDENSFDRTEYSKEELVAELGSSFLCAESHIDAEIIDNSAGYIAHWLTKLQDDKSMVLWAAGKAQAASNMILNVKYEKEKEG